MPKSSFQTAYAKVYFMSKFIIEKTYAKNLISELPKFLVRKVYAKNIIILNLQKADSKYMTKTFFLKVFAKTRNQFL